MLAQQQQSTVVNIYRRPNSAPSLIACVDSVSVPDIAERLVLRNCCVVPVLKSAVTLPGHPCMLQAQDRTSSASLPLFL